MFKRLLVPLDETPQALAALQVAQAIGDATGGAITVVHFVAPGAPVDPAAPAGAAASASDVPVETLIRIVPTVSSVPAEIVATACERHAELVVMAAHARHGLARLRAGSMTEDVLAHCPIPVILVGPAAAATPAPHPLSPLLVLVDGSAASAATIDLAADFAAATGTELFLLRVIVPAPAEDQVSGDGAHLAVVYDRQALADAQHYVQAVSEDLQQRGFVAQGRAIFGPLAETILTVADQLDAGLIVMSTHALTGPARDILGSVAGAVVRETPRPILLLRRRVAAGLRQR